MIVIFKEADTIRAESDAAHKEFVKAQEAADEQHKVSHPYPERDPGDQ